MTRQRIGAFIAGRRKSRNITQSELAEKMGVSDKAVSKWERNLSYPDITLTPKLAKELGVTVDELLNGEQSAKVEDNAGKSSLMKRLMQSIGRTDKQKMNQFIFACVSIVFIVTIAAALIVSSAVAYGTDNDTQWWQYVVGGVIVVWIPYALAVYVRKYKVVRVMLASVILLTLYAALIEYMTETTGWVRDIYLPILAISVVAIVAIVLLVRRKVSGWFIAAAILLAIALVSLVANFLADKYVISIGGEADSIGTFINLVTSIALLALAAFTGIVGLLSRK